MTRFPAEAERAAGIAWRAARCLSSDNELADSLVLDAASTCAGEGISHDGFLRAFVRACHVAGGLRRPPLALALPAAVGEPGLEQVLAAFAALPLEERLLAALHLVDRMDCASLARITGLPAEGVRGRLRRGLGLLCLALRGAEPGPVSHAGRP